MFLRTFVLVFALLSILYPALSFAEPVITPWSNEQINITDTFKTETITNDILLNKKHHLVSYDINNDKLSGKNSRSNNFNKQTTLENKKISALEKMYSTRIVDELEQFGYDLFGIPAPETQKHLNHLAKQNSLPMGAVQDNFILGIGDELEIVFTGQRTDRNLYKINSNGLILIPDFPPIPSAGRTIGQVRLSIEAAAKNMHNTQSYISLASVRQIGTLIVGHVKRPGRHTMTVFHTVLDAIMDAGGVDKTGSLRQIKLVRNGRSTIIDLYGLLLHGSTNMDLRLRDGDRIIVPSIGPTVAVVGEVKRPGIYEILPAIQGMRHKPKSTSEKLTLNEMLELGGGVLSPGKNRYLNLEILSSGKESVKEVHEPFVPLFSDGSILMISKGQEKRAGTIELIGHTRRPGMHALNEVSTLAQLLSSEDILGNDIYPLIGVIERWDSEQLTHKILDFPLRLVLKGHYDQKLHDSDTIYLFSNVQIANLNKKELEKNTKLEEFGSQDIDFSEENKISNQTISSFLKERSAFVRGAIRRPGAYPVSEGTTLDSILAVAGGLTLEANTSNIEVTSALHGQNHQSEGRSGTRRTSINFSETQPEDVMIESGDAIRINQKFKKIKDKSVLIVGEIINPGRYDLMSGDKISDLLERAGGFTLQAYPEGAIFSRENERRAEKTRFKAQARDMKRAISAALEIDDKKINAGKIAEARALAIELENAEAVGRITVEADIAILKVQPELDMLLETGDRLYIPKRSLNVRVSGEVLSSASLQFRKNKDPLSYIHEAGGFTFNADKKRTFVLYPNGSAQPLQVSAWNHNATFIPPGSTIVVPRDPEPFNFIESAKDISQILSNLAITAIFIDDVRDD